MIITYTGKYFDYDNITKDSINIDDIIPAITRLNRFMGHTARPYSVGEHTLMCYYIAKKLGYSIREQMLVLAHDFTEAYCGDVNTDLKNRIPEYKVIERKVELAIYDYLEIQPPTDDEEEKIRTVDLTALVIEMRDLTHHDHRKKIEEVPKYIALDMLDDENLRLLPDVYMREGTIIDALLSIFENLIIKEEVRG